MTRAHGEIVPSCGWFGDEYTQVWRVVVNGHQVGIWTKPRWARRDLRWHLRHAQRRRP
jgi:hypothetical protein